MKRLIAIVLTLAMVFAMTGVSALAEGKLTFGYITPGPDTWYLRDVEGFQAAAELLGVEVVVINSNYDVSQELANIENLVNQQVDGISVFSFNESGAITAAIKGDEAGIPVVATDSVGTVFNAGCPVAGAVDFDWAGMGVDYATWMAENHPGKDFVIITGNFESVPCQTVNKAMEETAAKLGQNKLIKIEEGEYTPAVAANKAEDLVNSGLEFGILFVMNEDMAAAVRQRLEDMGVADKYIIIAQNGSPVGVEMIKNGSLSFTISSSPGWEGFIAALALYDAAVNKEAATNVQYNLPNIAITPETDTTNPVEVVPWEVNLEAYKTLTAEHFPALYEYIK
ncbi:MAG: sugar ABC transporter substrate-binding protein [Clostridia bacterium]|nr:sugar ABC transporter substrate-binding protein [Clostridia bacterium]